jgi:hypothetical protein
VRAKEAVLPANPIDVVGRWLPNLLDPEIVNDVVAPDATYVSLNTENDELNQIMPWVGTSHGPQAVLDNLGKVFGRWESQAFRVTTMFASGENVAVFGDFRYGSGVFGRERSRQRLVRLGVGELGRRDLGGGRGVREPRRHGGHRDPVASHPDGERARHADQRALGRDVGQHVCVRWAPEGVGHDDDHAPEAAIAHAGANACVSSSADSTLTACALRQTSSSSSSNGSIATIAAAWTRTSHRP